MKVENVSCQRACREDKGSARVAGGKRVLVVHDGRKGRIVYRKRGGTLPSDIGREERG